MARPSLILSVLAILVIPQAARAQIGFRQVTSTHPVAVQRGKTSEIEVRCNYTLDGCYKVFFDRGGLSMKFAETKPKSATRRNRGSVGTPFKFDVDVPEDCPLGIREFRLATPQAVSSVGMLMVTDFPVVSEQKRNDTADRAQSISLPAAVCGTIERREDVDFYSFTAKRGQRLVFEVFAQRVTEKIHNMVTGANMYLMDSIITLYDADGRELIQNDDAAGGDALLMYEFPQDGKYIFSVRDVRYAGNDRYTYCVEVSDRPFIRSIYPLAVQQGGETALELTGVNLDSTTQVRVQPSANQEPGWIAESLNIAGRDSNPIEFKCSPHEQFFENVDATETADATRFTFPAGLNGRLEQPGDVDEFSFSAAKGNKYEFLVEARQRGSRIDSVLSILDSSGKRLASNDDLSGGLPDSGLVFEAPADGEYALRLTDLGGNGGVGYAYHVNAETAQPDFSFTGEYYYAMLAPGTRMIWFVRVTRKHGFEGAIDFAVEGLPRGVRFVPLTLPGHMNDGAIILEAADDAKVDARLVRVAGTANVQDVDGATRTIKRYGIVTAELQSQGGGQARWPINTQIVGVSKKMDLTRVDASPGEIVLPRGGSVTIDVTIERHKDYAGKPVTLAMAFTYFTNVFGAQLPPDVKVSPKSQTRLTNNKVKGTIVLQADKDAKPVDRLPIAVMARVSVTFSIATNYASNPLYLTIPGADDKPRSAVAASGPSSETPE